MALRCCLLALVLLATSCQHKRIFSTSTIRQLPVQQYAKQLATDSNYYLIDVRTPMEYSMSHIDSAINISYVFGRFQRRVEALDTNRTVYLYCQTAHRSPHATKALKRAGFTRIYDLKHGYHTYRKHQRRLARKQR